MRLDSGSSLKAAFVALGLFLALVLVRPGASGLEPGAPAPELRGGPWLNGPPLRLADLRGKVVLVDMWTFG